MHNNNRSTLSSTVRSLLIAGGLITASLAFSTGVSAADLTINQSLPDSAILSKGPGGQDPVAKRNRTATDSGWRLYGCHRDALCRQRLVPGTD